MKLLLALSLVASLCALANADGKDRDSEKQLEIYKNLLLLKRKEHVQTVDTVSKVEDFAKQFKSISFAFETIFPVLEESLTKLEEQGFTPDSPFPTDEALQDVLGKVYENVLFFGDFLLRMPDMSKKVFASNRNWKAVLEKAIKFCEDSKELFVGRHGFQLNLMAQEIGLKPKDDDYINPYKKKMERKRNDAYVSKEEVGNQRAAFQRGPKLRGNAKHAEL